MDFYFRGGAVAHPSLRRSFLDRALRTHFEQLADNPETMGLSETSNEDTLDLFLGLSAFAPAETANTSVFVGISCAPALMLGKNTLVCTRSLPEELSALEQRIAPLADAPATWCSDVLANYERCIFLDQRDMAASIGFSPWIELSLVPQLPIRLAPVSGFTSPPPIFVFLHNPAMGEEGRALCHALKALDTETGEVTLITAASSAETTPEFTTDAIHIHCGYAQTLPVVGLAPWDSIANGVYSVLFGNCDGIGGLLKKEIKPRSYVECLADRDEVEAAVAAVLERLATMKQAGLKFNPEIRGFDTLNSQYVETQFSNLDKRIAL